MELRFNIPLNTILDMRFASTKKLNKKQEKQSQKI